MISRGTKQGARRANLRKREKTDGLLGLKQGAGWTNLRKTEKTNALVRAKTGGGGWANLSIKKEYEWISRG